MPITQVATSWVSILVRSERSTSCSASLCLSFKHILDVALPDWSPPDIASAIVHIIVANLRALSLMRLQLSERSEGLPLVHALTS